MNREILGIQLEVVSGDITSQADIECVVNAANARLLPGGGVAGAIHRVAGPGLVEECRPLAPISPGKAVITSGHNLPNKYVIHCLGPVFGIDTPSDELLADCYRNALQLADQHGVSSIAFPSISTGVFGYPMVEAAEVAFLAVQDALSDLRSLRTIRFVLFGAEATEIHEDALSSLSE
jgi:O-acetyl-ADP-ribose deacetylase (regulator of RNase III)